MESGQHMESAEGWGLAGEEWARVEGLLALVRSAREAEELSPERRDRIRERVLERVEKRWARRRMARALMAGASALLAGVLLVLGIRRHATR